VYTAAVQKKYPGWDASRQTVVKDLASSAHVPLVYIDHFGSWWGERSSRDVKHLSREGAQDFTRQVWAQRQFRDIVLSGLAKS
jgi:hypothetical protein